MTESHVGYSGKQIARTVSRDTNHANAFVADFRRKVENLTQALADGRLRAIQAVVRAVTGD